MAQTKVTKHEIDWSGFSNNAKSTSTTQGSFSNTSQSLASIGGSLSFTLASAGVALVTVTTSILSSSDFEHRPEVWLNGAYYARPDYQAQVAGSSRAQPRTFSCAVPLAAGVNTITAGLYLVSSTSANGYASISAIVLGNVTA